MSNQNNPIGKTYINTTGKRVQFPLRLSDEYNWSPNEEVTVIREQLSDSDNVEGYILHNIDYMGVHESLRHGWISKKQFSEVFTQLK